MSQDRLQLDPVLSYDLFGNWSQGRLSIRSAVDQYLKKKATRTEQIFPDDSKIGL